jgi:hypothetical protein
MRRVTKLSSRKNSKPHKPEYAKMKHNNLTQTEAINQEVAKRCTEHGCTEQAEILKTTGERWCRQHAQDAVNRASVIVNATIELEEHRASGGKLS